VLFLKLAKEQQYSEPICDVGLSKETKCVKERMYDKED
jgi:hypothetical protein